MAKNNQKDTKKEKARLEAYANRILKEVEYYEERNRELYSLAWV